MFTYNRYILNKKGFIMSADFLVSSPNTEFWREPGAVEVFLCDPLLFKKVSVDLDRAGREPGNALVISKSDSGYRGYLYDADRGVYVAPDERLFPYESGAQHYVYMLWGRRVGEYRESAA